MSERNRESITESCPKQEVDMQESCDTCETDSCDTEDTGCTTCE